MEVLQSTKIQEFYIISIHMKFTLKYITDGWRKHSIGLYTHITRVNKLSYILVFANTASLGERVEYLGAVYMDAVTTKLVEVVYYKVSLVKNDQFTRFPKSDYTTAAIFNNWTKRVNYFPEWSRWIH